jgi:hypothetical protein
MLDNKTEIIPIENKKDEIIPIEKLKPLEARFNRENLLKISNDLDDISSESESIMNISTDTLLDAEEDKLDSDSNEYIDYLPGSF